MKKRKSIWRTRYEKCHATLNQAMGDHAAIRARHATIMGEYLAKVQQQSDTSQHERADSN